MSKSVCSCGKHIGDAGIHIFIIARIGGQLPGHDIRAKDVPEVISECDHLNPNDIQMQVVKNFSLQNQIVETSPHSVKWFKNG